MVRFSTLSWHEFQTFSVEVYCGLNMRCPPQFPLLSMCEVLRSTLKIYLSSRLYSHTCYTSILSQDKNATCKYSHCPTAPAIPIFGFKGMLLEVQLFPSSLFICQIFLLLSIFIYYPSFLNGHDLATLSLARNM